MNDIRRQALPLRHPSDLDPLLDRIGDARYVLLGEASHGTAEYYDWRAELTLRLVREKGFSFVGVEGDWPDCYEVNASVTLAPDAPDDPRDALHDFERWPTWMWANEQVVRFTRRLREHNAGLPDEHRVGFYGLDVYSLWDSLRETVDYLRQNEPAHVETALQAVRCFEPYREDAESYAWSTTLVPTGCEAEVVGLLSEVRQAADRGGGRDRDALFNAEQNARAVRGAEAYYRAMIRGGPDSWNIRDRHMVETLDELMEHHGPDAKAIVWEHNTHIGDARYTDMARAGMVNVGQLVRERHGDEGVVAVGFGGYRGSVIASPRWGGRIERMPLPDARTGSVESLLHRALAPDLDAALFVFGDEPPAWSLEERGHRAVGVVYSPEREALGNYVPTVLGRRYDAFCWFDRTEALTPLHGVHPDTREPEGWPFGE
ncbi:erythromycin esterase family protein [Herbiconiux sp. SYSU D00978]|uniref:erythromycin esterase family protein n=1 Tax=Herbiconiux sp. SYSU D00978 TaxID=2812562 RepID=UPI001A959F95|nr:erythromycin esterase family protein [Herbiconiux sp. SYSU D00978]